MVKGDEDIEGKKGNWLDVIGARSEVKYQRSNIKIRSQK